jgi:hypothetical protein
MNINIEKISNGYVATIDGKKTFFDVPEAICGATAEWVLEECKALEADPSVDISNALKFMAQQQVVGQAAQQQGILPSLRRAVGLDNI